VEEILATLVIKNTSQCCVNTTTQSLDVLLKTNVNLHMVPTSSEEVAVVVAAITKGMTTNNISKETTRTGNSREVTSYRATHKTSRS
jgi:hypothetical protein